jgi:hypothetical protein
MAAAHKFKVTGAIDMAGNAVNPPTVYDNKTDTTTVDMRGCNAKHIHAETGTIDIMPPEGVWVQKCIKTKVFSVIAHCAISQSGEIGDIVLSGGAKLVLDASVKFTGKLYAGKSGGGVLYIHPNCAKLLRAHDECIARGVGSMESFDKLLDTSVFKSVTIVT